jgi:uncharacterized protein YycO
VSRTRERTPVTVQTFEVHETITCDKCGAVYDENDWAVNELDVRLDPEQCVSYGHRRDYCADCAAVIWAAICALIGADPDSEVKTGYGDDDG